MKVVPSIEEIRSIAASGKYDVVPVSCEILSDFTTPIEVIRILKNASTHAYMLESAQADERWGRYTFLGFDPKLEITCINGEITYGGKTEKTDDPSAIIREILSHFKSPRLSYLPSFTANASTIRSFSEVKILPYTIRSAPSLFFPFSFMLI